MENVFLMAQRQQTKVGAKLYPKTQKTNTGVGGRVNAKAYGANVYFSKKKKNKNCVKEKIEKIKI